MDPKIRQRERGPRVPKQNDREPIARRIRDGVGVSAEPSLREIGRQMGVIKRRVRQTERRAHARLRRLAHPEAVGPSIL